jgi:hypothetical protein
MSISSQVITLSTSPTLIATSSGTSLTDPNTAVVNSASTTIFVGGSGVDTTDGTPIHVNGSLAIDLYPGDELYAVASAGTPTVKVLTNRNGAS